jgi:hypothetical protein
MRAVNSLLRLLGGQVRKVSKSALEFESSLHTAYYLASCVDAKSHALPKTAYKHFLSCQGILTKQNVRCSPDCPSLDRGWCSAH